MGGSYSSGDVSRFWPGLDRQARVRPPCDSGSSDTPSPSCVRRPTSLPSRWRSSSASQAGPARSEQDDAIDTYVRWSNQHAGPIRDFAVGSKIRTRITY